MVAQQLTAVCKDIGVDAIKTGMLYSSATIRQLIATLSSLYTDPSLRPPIVVDPVCVSTSGHSLFPIEALDSLRKDLFPYATVITPNVPEGELLADLPAGSIRSVEDMLQCAKKLGGMGVRWVYLKGGHLPLGEGKGKHVVDVLWDSVEKKEVLSHRPFLDQKNTHGTGCTLSSAIAAELANGKNGGFQSLTARIRLTQGNRAVPEAVRSAADYVAQAIATAYPLGSGSGPVNHFHMMGPRSLPLSVPRSLPRSALAHPPFTAADPPHSTLHHSLTISKTMIDQHGTATSTTLSLAASVRAKCPSTAFCISSSKIIISSSNTRALTLSPHTRRRTWTRWRLLSSSSTLC